MTEIAAGATARRHHSEFEIRIFLARKADGVIHTAATQSVTILLCVWRTQIWGIEFGSSFSRPNFGRPNFGQVGSKLKTKLKKVTRLNLPWIWDRKLGLRIHSNVAETLFRAAWNSNNEGKVLLKHCSFFRSCFFWRILNYKGESEYQSLPRTKPITTVTIGRVTDSGIAIYSVYGCIRGGYFPTLHP